MCLISEVGIHGLVQTSPAAIVATAMSGQTWTLLSPNQSLTGFDGPINGYGMSCLDLRLAFLRPDRPVAKIAPQSA